MGCPRRGDSQCLASAATPLDRELIGTLVRVGTPVAVDLVIFNASFLSIVGMLGRIDEAGVAAHEIGLRIQAKTGLDV